ncbi:MAG: NADH-quinone oxidoreductase subunit NuoG [Armatimonadetes bacterium]|nr:NADH-quinone oxidoreductase subunit NuoG [Armatimonadota bacterium]
MAAVASTEMVKIKINDIPIEVPKGELIVESVKRLGLEIPIFCYHPRMKPVGMCRMCLVEVGFEQQDGSVRMMPKPQAGCTLPAADGMVVFTESEQVHKDRKGVLEFLLINHPLDCPICDRGGECPLQNNTLAYGPSTSRFIEIKRHAPKAFPLSEYVTLDLERCIQCGRCVRFTEEISGDSQLAFRFRGANMQPSTYQLTDFESKFSGNVIEICPVGALTSAKYRFRARPWDLETKGGVCTLTPCGTNVYYDYRAGKLIRINGRTNEAVNEEWTSDKTKFGHDALYNNPERLTAPNMRKGDEFVRVSWGEAYKSISAELSNAGSKVAMLISPRTSNEGIFSATTYMSEVVGSDLVDHRSVGDGLASGDRLEALCGEPKRTPIAELESQSAVLVFGTSLADEQPMSFLRVRKGWFQNGMKVINVTSKATDVDSFAFLNLHYKPGTAQFAAAALASALGVDAARGYDFAKCCESAGLNQSDVKAAAEALKGENVTFLTTHSLCTSPSGANAYKILAGTAGALNHGFNYMGLECNTQGAIELGALPKGDVSNTYKILEECANGNVQSLILVDFDPIALIEDKDLAKRALENVNHLVVVASAPTESAAYASVVLPMALPAEQDGTYTSSEYRVQRMKPILTAPGESKAVWRIFNELLARAKDGKAVFNPSELMDQMIAAKPQFSGARYDRIPADGYLIPQPEGGFRSDAFSGGFPQLS